MVTALSGRCAADDGDLASEDNVAAVVGVSAGIVVLVVLFN